MTNKNPNAVELGRKGGQAKSEKKRLAVLENLKKANEKRLINKKIKTKQHEGIKME